MVWILVALGAVFVVANYACVIASHRSKRHISMIPPLGGVVAAAGLASLAGWKLGLAALFIDPAMWALVIWGARAIRRPTASPRD